MSGKKMNNTYFFNLKFTCAVTRAFILLFILAISGKISPIIKLITKNT